MNLLWTTIILAVAVIASSMISGFFLTFSDFLMRSLKLVKSSAGIEVMQNINHEIGKSITIFLLWGMLWLSVALIIYAYLYVSEPAASWIIGGGLLYFIGVLIVSYLFNIPMNNQLKSMNFSESKAAIYWNNDYVGRWVYWNYVRAITAGGAAVCFLVANILLNQRSIPLT